MTELQIRQCIKGNNLQVFYKCPAWLHLRSEVLEDDKHECQICKAKGIYTPATIVHHINHVRKHPELALSKHYFDGQGVKRRQLISVCDACHEREHPDRLRKTEPKPQLTEERW